MPRAAPARRAVHAGAARAVVAIVIGWTVMGCAGLSSSDDHEGPAPLHHTFDSLEGLASAVLSALAQSDTARLEELALSELEFRTVVWPELPASRPERNVPFGYAWGDLHQKSTNGLRRLVAARGGQHLELVAVEFTDETTPYQAFVVHRDSRLVVTDEDGTEQRLRLFGAVLQRDDEFKLFSYVVD